MKILTIISNYNENKEIINCIDDFRKNSTIESDLLVIDNCSTDNSLNFIVDSGVSYIKHSVNTGGSAGVIKTSLLYAYLNDYDIYCHMDGDNQHNASELKKLIEPIKEDKADLVIGSRFINKEGFQSHLIRRFGINLFSKVFSKITKNRITDLTSGFRAYNRKSITFFATQYKHEFEACVQMLTIAHYANLRIREVPVIMNPRLTGKSEFNFINGLKFPFFGLISFIGTILQKGEIRDSANAILR